jgi:peptidoglycan/LPS O-acetylase OafA/YrhL
MIISRSNPGSSAIAQPFEPLPISSLHGSRLDHLDALRGLAALSVICFHYNLAYGLPYGNWLLSNTPLHIWWDGFAAVSMFFVLSGLVLSIRHFRTTPVPRLMTFSYSGFLASRACRILLPYLFVLLVSAIVWPLSARHLSGAPRSSPWFHAFWLTPPTVRNVLRQANLFHLTGPFTLVPQAWSLAVEIVLSLLVPLGVLIAARGTVWLLIGAMIAVGLGGMSPFTFHFAMGIALAKHYRPIVAWLEPRQQVRWWLGGGSALLYAYRYLGAHHAMLHHGNLDWYIPGIGAAVLLMVCSSSPAIRQWLSKGWVHYIGRISYSIYLSHFMVLMCLTPRFLATMEKIHHFHWAFVWAAGLLFTCGVSIAISDPIYRFVEVPTIALGRWLSPKVPQATAGMRGLILGKKPGVARPIDLLDASPVV